ncbi:major facilitator superfamily domain-containing protein [Chaetomidium leptoderma]|uniref:Major facilitator superfamily domain-containing protein n=1 Tax=Chaetomidium leptoderma TaxID=669021 RepID=A0AAN6VD59_9PEZI|nr:major facilitator superfamily domain-containing protein [Chaetomidium leptoderma]
MVVPVTRNDTLEQHEVPRAEGRHEVDNDPTLQGYRLYAVVIGVCFGALMMSLDIAIIGTALPSIMSEFGDSTNIAWYPAAFTLATCALTPVAGKMAPVFPLDLVYSSFTCIFLVGSIVCGWAPTSSAFIAGRAIGGIGAAGVASNGLTILVTIAPVTKRPMFMGLGASGTINIPFNIITLTVVSFFFRPQQGRGGSVSGRIKSLDLGGCFIFVPAIFMFLVAMQTGGEDGVWSSPTVIGLFEWRKGGQAMRTVVFSCLFASTHMGALTIAGIRVLPTVITQIVATIVASGLAMRIRYYNPWFFLSPIFMCASSVIQGFGAGFGMQMSSLSVQLELKDNPELVPVGIALVMFLQYLGATVLQIIAGAVFNSELSSQLGNAGIRGMREVAAKDFPELLDPILEAYSGAITRVFFVPVGAAVLGFFLAFGIKWTLIEGAAGGGLAKLRAAKAAKAKAQQEQTTE